MVAEATSAQYDAEYDPAVPMDKGRKPRLELITQDPSSDAPGSLALTLTSAAKSPRPINADPEDLSTEAPKVEASLDQETWEVVRDKDDAPAVRAISKPDPKADPNTKAMIEGQEIAFRTTAKDPSVEVTKVYRIWKGEDGFEGRPQVRLEGQGLEVHLPAVRPPRHPDRGGVVHLDLPRRLLRPGQGELDGDHHARLDGRREVQG